MIGTIIFSCSEQVAPDQLSRMPFEQAVILSAEAYNLIQKSERADDLQAFENLMAQNRFIGAISLAIKMIKNGNTNLHEQLERALIAFQSLNHR